MTRDIRLGTLASWLYGMGEGWIEKSSVIPGYQSNLGISNGEILLFWAQNGEICFENFENDRTLFMKIKRSWFYIPSKRMIGWVNSSQSQWNRKFFVLPCSVTRSRRFGFQIFLLLLCACRRYKKFKICHLISNIKILYKLILKKFMYWGRK